MSPQQDWMEQLGKDSGGRQKFQGMSEQEQFMYQHHLSNLRQGGVKNADGSTSTYKAIGVESDGKYYMLPTVWDNKLVSNEEAIKRAGQTGFDKFPSYGSQEEAEARYSEIHGIMEKDLPQ